MNPRQRVLNHAGSLLGGMVHNLNTPLMWIMGRSQLIETRNDMLSEMDGMSPEEISKIAKKNREDLASILEGAEAINSILKAVSYKIQMAQGEIESVDLREYLRMETDFLMADMRFKHDTKRELQIDTQGSCYVKIDYNVLSSAFVEAIDAIIDSTDKGRVIKIALDGSAVKIVCPDARPETKIKDRLDSIFKELSSVADVYVDDSHGVSVSIQVRQA